MFDSMNLEEALNDLYEAGVKDDTLALLYEAYQEIFMNVKTPVFFLFYSVYCFNYCTTYRQVFEKVLFYEIMIV